MIRQVYDRFSVYHGDMVTICHWSKQKTLTVSKFSVIC